MAVWFVGQAPVAHYDYEANVVSSSGSGNTSKGSNNTSKGAKTPTSVFFLKSQIFSGQVDLSEQKEIVDYAWLTKEELPELLDADYWNAVRDALADL